MLVFIANTICICVGSASANTVGGVPSAPSSHCQPKQSEGSCHGHSKDQQPVDDKGDGSHSCGHCAGTVSMEASQPKSSVASAPLLPPIHCPLPFSDFFSVRSVHNIPPALRSQPPPVSPPTLLNLACSLTI